MCEGGSQNTAAPRIQLHPEYSCILSPGLRLRAKLSWLFLLKSLLPSPPTTCPIRVSTLHVTTSCPEDVTSQASGPDSGTPHTVLKWEAPRMLPPKTSWGCDAGTGPACNVTCPAYASLALSQRVVRLG